MRYNKLQAICTFKYVTKIYKGWKHHEKDISVYIPVKLLDWEYESILLTDLDEDLRNTNLKNVKESECKSILEEHFTKKFKEEAEYLRSNYPELYITNEKDMNTYYLKTATLLFWLMTPTVHNYPS